MAAVEPEISFVYSGQNCAVWALRIQNGLLIFVCFERDIYLDYFHYIVDYISRCFLYYFRHRSYAPSERRLGYTTMGSAVSEIGRISIPGTESVPSTADGIGDCTSYYTASGSSMCFTDYCTADCDTDFHTCRILFAATAIDHSTGEFRNSLQIFAGK